MQNQSFRGIGPIAFLMFMAAGATVFFPASIGFVVAFAACFVVACVAAIADRTQRLQRSPSTDEASGRRPVGSDAS